MKQLIKMVMGFVVLTGAASATLIEATLPDFSGPGMGSGFPSAEMNAGTFEFALNGEAVIAASISGSWGNDAYPDSSAGADVYLDGILVAQCVEYTDCWYNASGTQYWSFVFSAAQLASGLFDDGSAVLTVVQTSSYIVRLGSLSLQLETVAVPLPGVAALFGAGLFGLLRRRA